jgi:hypothetical protein
MCSHSQALLLIIFKSSCKLPKFADNNDGETICAIKPILKERQRAALPQREDSTKSVEMQSNQDKKRINHLFHPIGNKASWFCAIFLFILQIDASKTNTCNI